MGAGTGGERVERWVEGWSVLPIEEWRANYMFKRNERRRRRDPASIIGRTNANLHTHTHRAQRAGSRFPPHIYFYVINLLLRLLFSLRLFLHGITNIFSLREIKMSPPPLYPLREIYLSRVLFLTVEFNTDRVHLSLSLYCVVVAVFIHTILIRLWFFFFSLLSAAARRG
jgi:hypothetical protein